MKIVSRVMWLTEAVLYMYGMVFIIWENPSVLDQNVTRAVYRRVLEEHLVSHGRAWYRNNWMLPDDNARPHRVRVVDVYFQEQDINPL